MKNRSALCLLLALCGVARAQVDIAGKLRGTITDASGAVVANANVRAENQKTNVSLTTTSSEGGTYSFESVPPGVYTVTCEVAGFAPFTATENRVDSFATTTLNVQMKVGTVSDRVVVEAAATQVDTSTPTIQNTLNEQTLMALPVSGRDVRRAAELLQPGAVDEDGEGSFVRYNGTRGRTNNYKIDSTENINYFIGSANPFPAAENLEEFTVQTNATGAMYGNAGGAQVSAIIKSGTNAPHGTGWAYLTNSGWNANSWQGNQSGAARPSGKQRWYGGNFGGPVWLPKLYDGRNRTFFFVAFEYTNPSNQQLIQQRVPTLAERNGDFSQSFYGLPKVNGTATSSIDPSQFSPIAKAVLANARLLPAPNGPEGRFTWLANTISTTKSPIVKIDETISSRHRISGTYSGLRNTATYDDFGMVFGLPHMPSQGTTAVVANNDTFAVNDVFTFSPNLLNTFTFGLTRTCCGLTRGEVDPDLDWRKLGLPNAQNENGASPTQVGLFVQGWGNNGFVLWGNYEDRNRSQSVYLSDNVTWIKGRHTMSAGYQQRIFNQKKLQNWNAAPFVTFSSSNAGSTGNPFADFLLGQGAGFSQTSTLDSDLGYPSREAYFEDRIKVSRKLTTTLGLRWSPLFGIRDNRGQLTAFRPGQQSTQFPNAPLGLVVPGDKGIGPATYPRRWNNWGPRIGIAYDLRGDGRAAIRAGYGIYYDYAYLKGLNPITSSIPFGISYSQPSPVDLSDPYQGLSLYPYEKPTPGSQSAQNVVFPKTPLSILSFSPDFNSGRIHQWNAQYETELFRGYKASVAYVGTRGTHLTTSVDINSPIFVPNASLQSNQQQRRPYPQFQSIAQTFSGSISRYNALQLSLNKRYSHGFAILANYTLSRATDDGDSSGAMFTNSSWRDPRNRRLDYGPSAFDRRHVFSLNYTWSLPLFRDSNRYLRTALGGWVLGGISRAQSGTPLTITSPAQFNQASAGAWANYVGGPIYGDRGSRAAEAAGWLNAAAFCPANATGPGCTVDPTAGVTQLALGNTTRGFARGPGSFSNDMTLNKQIPISERFGRLECRAAAFNVFNHTILNNPDTNVGSGRNFGRITSAWAPRTIQLSLRYQF